jgi:hypothetical protein
LKTKVFILFVLLLNSVSAYTNSTMTDEFRELFWGNPIAAIHNAYLGIWGAWFWLLITMTLYAGIMMYQQSMTIASIWMIFCLGAYGYLFEGLGKYNIVIYLAVVVWVVTIFMKAVSPVWKD